MVKLNRYRHLNTNRKQAPLASFREVLCAKAVTQHTLSLLRLAAWCTSFEGDKPDKGSRCTAPPGTAEICRTKVYRASNPPCRTAKLLSCALLLSCRASNRLIYSKRTVGSAVFDKDRDREYPRLYTIYLYRDTSTNSATALFSFFLSPSPLSLFLH